VLPEQLELDAEDEEMLDMFGSLNIDKNKAGNKSGLTKQEKKQAIELQKMAANLDEKISSKKENARQQEIQQDYTKDPKVQKVYGDIAGLFAKYRSGKIPRAFKILSRADQWESLMQLTKPETWSPHAMWSVSKLYTQEMPVDRLKIFFQDFLMPAVRRDIQKHKKLNYQYFAA